MSLENTATQQGVEDEVIESTPNPRDQAIAQIALRANQEHEESIRSAEENIYQEGKEENEDIEQPEDDKPSEDMVTIKVDGEERQVLRSLVEEAGIKALQKNSAADKRLEEATMLFKQAQEFNKNMQLPQGAAPVQAEDESVQLARAIQYGSEDEAAAVIKRLQQEGRSQATPEQIATFVGDQIELRDAYKSFKEGYPEIQTDPYLKALAIQMESVARKNGDKRPYRELYSSIGENLRKWRGGNVPQVDKLERKASVQSITTASGRRQAPEQPKQKTPSDIINDIRRSRHQA